VKGFINKNGRALFLAAPHRKRDVSENFKPDTLKFKNGHLLISSPLGERSEVRGIFLEATLTPTLSRQREWGIIDCFRLDARCNQS
jgi:hypothetical protein